MFPFVGLCFLVEEKAEAGEAAKCFDREKRVFAEFVSFMKTFPQKPEVFAHNESIPMILAMVHNKKEGTRVSESVARGPIFLSVAFDRIFIIFV